MTIRRWIVRICVLALLAACAALPSTAADEPYDLYVFLPLTGPGAFLGKDEEPAVRAVERFVNAHGGIRGRPLHMIILDDQTNPTQAVQLANEVVAKHVPVFVGPAIGATCGAVAPLVQANGPVMFCLTPVVRPPSGSYVFVFNLTNRDFIANGLRYLKAKGVRRVALLQTTDATGIDGEQSAIEALHYPDLKDMQLVATEHFAPTDITVTAQITRIKAANPDGLVTYITGPALGTALRGLYESGFNGWIFTSSSNASKQQIGSYRNFLPDKLTFGTLGFQMQGILPSGVRVAKTNYLDTMHQMGISDPTIGNIVPWDPLMIVVGALQKLGTNATPTQIRDYILHLKDWPGINGLYDFGRGDQRGIDPKSTGAMRYDKANGDFVIISRPGGTPF
jgi:branched-chain amino acid transport system substrate-binding protein